MRSPHNVARLLGIALELSPTPDHRDSERSDVANARRWDPQRTVVDGVEGDEPTVAREDGRRNLT